jgi:hypothetical protein
MWVNICVASMEYGVRIEAKLDRIQAVTTDVAVGVLIFLVIHTSIQLLFLLPWTNINIRALVLAFDFLHSIICGDSAFLEESILS